MANAYLLYNSDAWDAATVTASSDATSGLTGANVVDDLVGKPWRSTGDTSEQLVFDLGSAKQIKAIGIHVFNLTSAATVKVQANATNSWGSPTLDDTVAMVTDADSNVLERLVWTGNQTLRYWRIDIADAANPDGYIQIGRVIGGDYWTPTINYANGFRPVMVDPSEGTPKPGRQSFWRQRKRFRRTGVTFPEIDRTDYEKWQAVFTKIGNSKPLLLMLDPTDYLTKDSMYCYLKTPLSMAHRLLGNYTNLTLTFEEVAE